MFASRQEIKEIIIAVCDRDFKALEKFSENKRIFEYFNNIDLTDNNTMDLIAYVHRHIAEQYIMRAKEQLEKIKNIKDENIKGEIEKVIYSIVPKNNFFSFEHNKEEYKDVEHYFD